MLGPQRGETAPGADDAFAHQQGADLRQRVTCVTRLARERVAGRIDDRAGVERHRVTAAPALDPSIWISAAATATAITAGSFPVIPGWPIGQVIRPIASGLWPAAASWAWNRVHLTLEPISPIPPSGWRKRSAASHRA